jgi:metal-responsive CopG/Arc/MetJ family transcriptional regulator
MSKVNVEANLLERASQAAEKAGYSSVEELVATAIENELKRIGEEQAEAQVADQLRGLGYIE